MTHGIILASASEIRRDLLRGAGVVHRVETARIDEVAIRAALTAEGVKPREIADALAEAKAQKVSNRHRDALVIGCDQVLEIGGTILAKPADMAEAKIQLQHLNGQQHTLLSAVVVYWQGQPEWRFVGEVKMHMRSISADYLDEYLQRNWQSIQHSVGCYKLEEEGARLFSRIEGDYFTVLGLPLIQLLTYLTEKGELHG